MGCNCNKTPKTCIITDDTGDKYIGEFYSSILEFINWFTSDVSEFHIDVHSKKLLDTEDKYSAYCVPMLHAKSADDIDEESTPFRLDIKKGKSYFYDQTSGFTWELGVKGRKKIETNKRNNVP